MPDAPSHHPFPPPPARPGPWPVVAAALVGCWVVAVTVPSELVGWLVDQVMLLSGLDRRVWLWPVVAVGTALLAGVPVLLLALLPRAGAVRATGRAWLGGLLALGALALLRTLPPVHHEAYLAALAATATLLAIALPRLPGRAAPTPPGRPAGEPGIKPSAGEPGIEPSAGGDGVGRAAPVTLLAVAAGLVTVLPWAWLGALGGLLETVLAAVAAAAVGLLAGALLDARLWAHFAVGRPYRPARLVLVGGLVAGVALLLVAAGTGQSGAQLPALLTLPPLGFVLAALHAPAARTGVPARSAPTRWLVGLGVFGPLAFVDPEEITLLLATTRDVPYWVAVTAAAGLAVGALLCVAYGVLLARPGGRAPRRGVAAATVVVLLAGVVAVHVAAGRPGLHGERLLVVLREQADLSGIPAGAPSLAGRDARAREVYRRLVATAERTQAGLRRDLNRLRLDPTPYYLVNAIEVDGGPGVRAWLSGRAEVGRVLVDQRLRPLPAAVPTSRGDVPAPAGTAWNVALIGANRVWSELGVTGAGVVVGSSDSGVDGGHPALAAGYRGGDDSWYDPWDHTTTPTDEGGHGTHTTGSAVGRDGIGVAPGASWVGCVNLDRNIGSPARYLDCLQFMLAPFPAGGDPFVDGRPERAPQVLTNSWGCPSLEGCDPGALRSATAALDAAGIFVVAAAGNTGPYCASIGDPPAAYPDVFTVGAADRDRELASFSSRGPVPGGNKPDLLAPGVGVLSAMPGGTYATLDGTSMATPQVAGVVALMWSANPKLVGDLDRTRRILRDTAGPAGSGSAYRDSAGGCGGDANLTGAGLVDAYAAVQAARAG